MASISQTQTISVSNTRLLRDFLDENRCPYVLCHIELKDGKKQIRANTIPKDWTQWSYDKCCLYNKNKADRKCKIMNINLRAGGFVIVDIDGGDIQKNLTDYGNQNITKSINREMPHIWFNRVSNDQWGTQTKVKGNDVDYLYSNVFEKVDSVMTNYDGFLDDFDWKFYLGEKPKVSQKEKKQKKKTIIIGNNMLENNDIVDGEPLLDLINIKYWTAYDSWRNLVWACIDHFGMATGIQVAINYSKQVPGVYEEGCVEKVAQHFQDGKITWGTAHYYAKESNPEAYAELMTPNIEPDDESLAHLFLYAFGQNITKDINGDNYVYFCDGWKKADKDTAHLLRAMISDHTQPIIKTAIKVNSKKIETLSDDDPQKEKLWKYCAIMSDSIGRIRSTAGTKAVYEKVCDILSKRNQTDIIFDVGEDQLYNIQFKNGVYELNNKRFRPRTKADYITKTLDWNYCEERNPEHISIVETFFKKVQPDPEMCRFLKEWLAYCLCGDTSHEVFKMNIGKGSNGKTAEFSIHMKCFPLYTLKVNNKTFCEDFTKRHKELIRQRTEPIRATFIEEMKMLKMDEEAVKDYTNGGNIPLEIMFGVTINFKSQAKLNTCSQHEPNMRGDGGVLRRGLLQRYTSTFMEDVDDDYQRHVYKKHLNFDKLFNDDAMKLAYFQVLVDNFKQIKIPKALRDNFKQSLDEGDNFKNVFEDCFEIIDEENRVAKSVVMAVMAEKGYKNWREILAEMKRLGCEYSDQKKVNGKKGCFLNIREIMEDEDEDH